MKKAASIVVFILLMTCPAYSAHDPVILIPGLLGSSGSMNNIKNYLLANGWSSSEIYSYADVYQMRGDLALAAGRIANKVNSVLESTGMAKVVLITWSAGALAARYYVKNIDDTKVSVFISIAGVNHGTNSTGWCSGIFPSCQQMIQGSDFLNELNEGTEVPNWPTIRYLTIRSNGDANVIPIESACLLTADEQIIVKKTGETYISCSDSDIVYNAAYALNHFNLAGLTDNSLYLLKPGNSKYPDMLAIFGLMTPFILNWECQATGLCE